MMRNWNAAVACCLACCLVTAAAARADVVAGDDFDGGATNGGLVPLSRLLDPDNTPYNALFGAGGNRFDRFGIANRTVGDNLGREGLPFDLLDDSLAFPNDRWGIIPSTKIDNFFVIVDLENSDNPISPRGNATWEFDISNFQDLALSVDLAMVGDFATDSAGRSDRFAFSYSIDGGPAQPLLTITSTNDNRGYLVVMENGSQYLVGDDFFFFDDADYDLLGCTLGVANSCTTEFDVFGDGSLVLRPDPLDANHDGHVYVDETSQSFPDTPIDPLDLTAGAIRIYEETNSFGTFSQPEVELFRNPLMVNGDLQRLLGNQLATFTEPLAGSGNVLTLTFEAEQYGGDQYFVFDNILIEGTPVGGGPSGDFNGDGVYNCTDVDALVAEIAGGSNASDFDLTGDGTVDDDDLSAWLTEAGLVNLGAPYLVGDATLDGFVDVSDFNAWNGNKFESTASWCSGDFNADGAVDVSDFNLWNGNKFRASGNLAAVPEPALGSLACAGLAWCLIRSRRTATRRRRVSH